jgi:hypothetical protein
MNPHAILLHPAQDSSHPLVQSFHTVYATYLLEAISLIRPTVTWFPVLIVKDPLFTISDRCSSLTVLKFINYIYIHVINYMERSAMLIDWQSQHSKNGYTTKSNLHA